MNTDFQIGSVLRENAYVGPFRSDRQSSLVVCEGTPGRWYELTSRGQVFAVCTQLSAITIVADNAAPTGAGLATLLSVLNPVGSGVNLEILQGWVFQNSGTPPAGYWAWQGAIAGTSITAAEVNARKGACLVGQGATRAKAWSQTALIGSPAQAILRPFPLAIFAGALTGDTPGQTAVDNVDGSIVVPPGGLLSLAPPGAGTGYAVAAGILYAEIPLPG